MVSPDWQFNRICSLAKLNTPNLIPEALSLTYTKACLALCSIARYTDCDKAYVLRLAIKCVYDVTPEDKYYTIKYCSWPLAVAVDV